MKKTNMFYPHFMVAKFGPFYSFCKSMWMPLYPVPMIIVFGFIIIPLIVLSPLLIWWYLIDVLSNILDWIGFQVFVVFPLYVYTQAAQSDAAKIFNL